MTNERRWNLQELTTTEWTLVDEPNVTNLSKEDAKVRIKQLVNEGYNPNSLRAVPCANN